MHYLFYLLFPLVMAGVAWMFPYKKPENFIAPNEASLNKIMKWGKISGWYYVAVIVLLLYLIGVQLCNFKHRFTPHYSDAAYIVLPDHMDWFMIGFIFILGIGVYIFMLMSKLYLGDDFVGYIDYSNSKSQYNTYKAVQPFAAFFSGLGLVLLFCLWNYGIYICRDKMVVRWFLSTGDKTYSYSQVKSVNFIAEDPDKKNVRHFDVVFTDGMDWDTSTGLPDDEKGEMMKYISQRSGMKIDTVENDPK
jgi:hypothetical protein